VRRRNFADLEEPPPEDDDSWEIGDDSESERMGLPGGSRKRRRPSMAPGGGPLEDRRFGGLHCSSAVIVYVARGRGSRICVLHATLWEVMSLLHLHSCSCTELAALFAGQSSMPYV
jgi:hypothetical protein